MARLTTVRGAAGAARRIGARWPVELLAALALACVYVGIMSGHPHSIDGMIIFNQARAIAYHGSLSFPEPIWWGGVAHSTSKYGLGLSLLYLPGLALWSIVQPFVPFAISDLADPRRPYYDPLYTLVGAPLQLAIVAATWGWGGARRCGGWRATAWGRRR